MIGQIVRQPVAKGAQITSAILGTNTTGTVTNVTTPAGLRSIAVQVDQITGVGTAIKTGDFVDMIVGLTGAEFPIVGTTPGTPGVAIVPGLTTTNSAKVLLQGLQVVGTILPQATTTEGAPAPSPSGGTSSGGTPIALNGRSEIVILAGSAQQVEAIKFAQMSEPNPTAITLVLRSPDDFIDPTTGAALAPADVKTTGVILKTLVDTYGVLPPDFIVSKGVVPGAAAPSPAP